MDDQGHGYPPERNAHAYPPPPVPRRWFWLALATGPLALAAIATGIVGISMAEQRDSVGFIDDEEVMAVVSVQCGIMTSSVEGLPVLGPDRLKAAILADQNLAVRQMVTRIRALDDATRAGDQPLDDWLADWDRLLEARERYADRVEEGFDGRLEVPRTGDDADEEITVRMDQAGSLAGCEVPRALLDSYLDGSVDA